MPWWVWLLIGLAVIALPLKLRMWKNILSKKAEHQQIEDDDF